MRLSKWGKKTVYDNPWKDASPPQSRELITELERVVKALKKGAGIEHGAHVKTYTPTSNKVISRTDKWLVFEGIHQWIIERRG